MLRLDNFRWSDFLFFAETPRWELQFFSPFNSMNIVRCGSKTCSSRRTILIHHLHTNLLEPPTMFWEILVFFLFYSWDDHENFRNSKVQTHETSGMTEPISINTQILQPLRPVLLILQIKPTFLLHGPMFAKLRKATITYCAISLRLRCIRGTSWRALKNKRTIRFVTCVRPHGTTRLPLDEFSWNFIIEYYSKICPENSRFIWQE
jgi:hypothetical protein